MVLKVAVTDMFAVMVTEQSRVPEHAPPHPLNTDPDCGEALSVTLVPLVYCVEQVAPQVIPAGLLTTAPVPVPAGVTVSA